MRKETVLKNKVFKLVKQIGFLRKRINVFALLEKIIIDKLILFQRYNSIPHIDKYLLKNGIV